MATGKCWQWAKGELFIFVMVFRIPKRNGRESLSQANSRTSEELQPNTLDTLDYFNTRSRIDIIRTVCHLLHFQCFAVAMVASVLVESHAGLKAKE